MIMKKSTNRSNPSNIPCHRNAIDIRGRVRARDHVQPPPPHSGPLYSMPSPFGGGCGQGTASSPHPRTPALRVQCHSHSGAGAGKGLRPAPTPVWRLYEQRDLPRTSCRSYDSFRGLHRRIRGNGCFQYKPSRLLTRRHVNSRTT